MQSNVVLLFSLSLGILLKLALTTVLYRFLSPRVDKKSYALLLSWMFAYLYMMFAMLLLSLFHRLDGPGIAVMMALGSTAVFLYSRKSRISTLKQIVSFRLSPIACVGIVSIVMLLGWLLLRSLYFLDNTWDAMVYSLPRLSIFGHHKTLFVHQNTLAINVFANEWVGELNCLYYMLMAVNEQATGFGNVENLAFLILVFYWFFDERDLPAGIGLLFSLLLVATPAMLGLAMTVKGDLLAAGFLLLSYSLFRKHENLPESPIRLFALLCGLGLCAGAKIMLVPVVGLMCLLLLYRLIRNGKIVTLWKPTLLGLLTFFISCSRYLVNLFVYKTPFMRVGAEGMRMGVDSFLSNMSGLSRYIFGPESLRYFISITEGEPQTVFNLGLGLLPLFIIPCALYALYAFFRAWNKSSLPLHLSILGGFLFFAFSTLWYPWSFRYYLPWVLLYSAIALSCTYLRLRRIQGIEGAVSCVSMAIVVSSVACMTGFNDCRPTTYEIASERNLMQRKLAGHIGLYDYMAVDEDLLSVAHGKGSFLVLQHIDRAIYPYMGDGYQNDVQLTADEAEFLNYAESGEYDAYVISGAALFDVDSITPVAWSKGYEMISAPGYDTILYYRAGGGLEAPAAFDPKNYDDLDTFGVGIYPEEDNARHWIEDDATLRIESASLRESDLEIEYVTYISMMEQNSVDPFTMQVYFDGVLVHTEPLLDDVLHTIIIEKEKLPETDKSYYVVEIKTNGKLNPELLLPDERTLAVQLYYLGPNR